MFKTGFVVGKFYPPHRGHKYLIDTACANAEQVTVMLVGRPEEIVSPALRAAWLREIHPRVRVIEVDDVFAADDSQGWADFTRKTLGYAPDAVFTSEDYGECFARYLGCQHVMVDRTRSHVPCSGTLVRQNPFAQWDYLEPCVRAFFVKRICVLGAESTGTTTLARALARHYHTVWVPEYGREYCESKIEEAGGWQAYEQWQTEEFTHIAQTQCDREDQAARLANKLLICDTNAFATNLWHERYLGKLSSAVEAISSGRKYDMVILTEVDIPFVQDGLRDGEHVRHNMHARFEELLSEQSIAYTMLSGPHRQRLKKAISLINGILAAD